MDKHLEHTDKDDYDEKIVIKSLENIQKVDDDTIQQILNNDESIEDCRCLWDLIYCIMLDKNLQKIDAVKELNKFHKKRLYRTRQRILKWGLSTAALLMLTLMGYIYSTYIDINHPIIAFTADLTQQEIILQNEDGKTIVLTENELLIPSTTSLPNSSKISNSDNSSNKKLEQTASLAPLQVLSIPRGENFKLTLSDGSEVWLNANSKFSYPVVFNGAERIVMLEGEAYFKVAPNKNLPFIVVSPNMTTQVLGTEFNVKDYSSEDASIVLISGGVEVTINTRKESILLSPGEELSFLANGEIELNEVDTESFVNWKDGYFYYDDLSLLLIMQDIGRWYNVNIEFHNTKAIDYNMHFIANRAMGVDHVINLLNSMKKVHASFQDNTIIIE